MKHLGNDAVQLDHVETFTNELINVRDSFHVSLEENSQLVENLMEEHRSATNKSMMFDIATLVVLCSGIVIANMDKILAMF